MFGQRQGKQESTGNALLASDDDHHGDHLKQRQIADCVGKLHSPAYSNNDLADNKRVLSNNLANIHEKDKQQYHNDGSQSINSAAAPSANIQQQSSLLSKSNSRTSPPATPAASSGATDSPPAPNRKQQAKPTGGVYAPAKQLPPATSAASNQAGLSVVENNEEDKKQANLNRNKKEKSKPNLWQNSLSRMSNKFSIFSGNTAKKSSPPSSNSSSNQQQDRNKQDLPASVTLDAWIETKVVSFTVFFLLQMNFFRPFYD